jgi:hypothetical protein
LPDEVKAAPEGTEPESDFLSILEGGVRSVLKSKKATPSERVAAISAGVKVAMIKHRISGDGEKGFFD